MDSLAFSNVNEGDAADWVDASTYAKGARVVRNRHVFESLIDGNKGNDPVIAVTAPSWLDLGAVNKWRMFDKRAADGAWLIGKATVNAESIVVRLKMGAVVNAIALVGLKGSSVKVTMTDANPEEGEAGVVYTDTKSLADYGIDNMYDYYFAPIPRKTTALFLDLPAYGTAEIEVSVMYPGGNAEIGMIVLGDLIDLGRTTKGSELALQNYSATTRDALGSVKDISRGSTRILDFDLRIPMKSFDNAFQTLERLKDTPVAWIGSRKYDSAVVIGRYEQLRMPWSDESFAQTKLEVWSLQ
ncbi:hypothetical protein [Pseudomonas oryzihabitans]|uniref:hypothetical protein n=1 Tax=Pseudomonas oryzihabitans TaxID=47885 RepID=UPI00289A25D2|nr:hypothetical protein [Pseudomonas oryzihabitans]